MVDKNLGMTREEMLAELAQKYNDLPRLQPNEVTAQMLAERMGWNYQKAQGWLKAQGYRSRIVYDDNDSEIMAYYKDEQI